MSFEVTFSELGLIETLRFSRAHGFVRLELHLARLAASSQALGHVHDEAKTRAALDAIVAQTEGEHLRVRLEQAQNGELKVSASAFAPLAKDIIWRAKIAAHRLDADDGLLIHKTTRREFYDAARVASGVEEAIFLNNRDEVCEGSITSLFVSRDGILITPPLSSGLLAGVLRAELLAQGLAREGVLYLDDLRDGFFFGNSLRGLIAGRLA